MNIFHFLFLRETKYIRLSAHQCQGCWECVAVCPEAVFVKMDRTRRPHVHVINPDACTGCKKCVRACANGAIEYTYVPKASQKPRQHLPEHNIKKLKEAPDPMNRPKVLPPAYFLIALLAIPLLHFLLPLLQIIPQPWNLFGIFFIMVGIVFELAADRLFHQAGTTVMPFAESQALVTSGVFRVTRNPMYLGFALILFGVAGLFGTLTPFLVVPVFMILIDGRFIWPEEMLLEQKFGQGYLDYKKKVRRWI